MTTLPTQEEEEARKAAARPEAWRFYRETLGSARYFLAPMVGCSGLAFRLLCRRHGTHVGVGAMINSAVYARAANAPFRRTAFESCAADAPAIAQLCGADADAMVRAAQHLAAGGQCVAVDVNLGCPQRVARKGAYGAFLAADPARAGALVARLVREARVPVTCKMRLADDVRDTVALARTLEAAGCVLLTVHGRTRAQTNPRTAPANWDHIARVVSVVPLFVLLFSLCAFHTCVAAAAAAAAVLVQGKRGHPGHRERRHPHARRRTALPRRHPCPGRHVRQFAPHISPHVPRSLSLSRRVQRACSRTRRCSRASRSTAARSHRSSSTSCAAASPTPSRRAASVSSCSSARLHPSPSPSLTISASHNSHAHSVENHPELRQELATAASNEEIYAVLDAIRSARDTPHAATPSALDSDALVLAPASAPVPAGTVLWRRVPCLRCAPNVRSRRCAGVPCTWVVLLGVGRAVLTQPAFGALRDGAHARDWLCRPHALYLCLENSSTLLAALLADGHACLCTPAPEGP